MTQIRDFSDIMREPIDDTTVLQSGCEATIRGVPVYLFQFFGGHLVIPIKDEERTGTPKVSLR